MFLISESDPGLCATSGLAKTISMRGGDFWQILRQNTFLKTEVATSQLNLFASSEVVHTSKWDFFLQFDIGNI